MSSDELDAYLESCFMSDQSLIDEMNYLSDVEDFADVQDSEGFEEGFEYFEDEVEDFEYPYDAGVEIDQDIFVESNIEESVFPNFSESAKKSPIIEEDKNLSGIGKEMLFHDSSYTLKDFALALLNVRQQFPDCIGDRLMSVIVGLFATFLERDNILQNYLRKSSSYYTANKLIYHAVTDHQSELRCQIYKKCTEGCITFAGKYSKALQCGKCQKVKKDEYQYFYLPLADRIQRLIISPLLTKLFHYDEYRCIKDGYVTDIYDGSVWRKFQEKLGHGEKLIGLEVSWDGARPFSKESESFWPIFYSILNFPPVLRGKIHFGLHLLTLDNGDHAVWDAVVSELTDLWNIGFVYNGIRYRIAILRITLDGKGLEYFTKTKGILKFFLLI
jgi:hypothetical protein